MQEMNEVEINPKIWSISSTDSMIFLGPASFFPDA